MPVIQHIAIIHFDFGAVRLLRTVLGELGIARPLFVTDRGIRAAGAFDRVVDRMAGDLVIFDGTPANPTLAAAEAGLALYRDHRCDGVVAVGGGSAIDCAKGVALLATHDGPIERYRAGGTDPVGPHIAPLVAIPTTAGTSSEIGRGMGLTLGGGQKGVFISRNLVPKVALYDPELTLSLPAAITAGTGIDAFAHCLEAFLSPTVNPPADAVALSGVRRLAANIARATHRPDDRAARWQMMMGAVEAGMAMWKGLGPAHALALSFEDLDLHHGTIVGVVLPETLRFQYDVLGGRAHALRDALGLPAEADLADHLAALNGAVGLPPNLRSLGVPQGMLPKAAAEAAQSVFNRSCLKPASEAQYLGLLERMWG